MPGLADPLKDLGRHDLKTAVASSSIRDHIRLIINSLGLTSYFNTIVSGEDVERGKPAPDIFLRAARELEVAP